jgi:hypothetical protein
MAFESGLIQAYGEKMFRRTDSYIKSRIPQKQGNPDEGVDPVEHVEFHFNSMDDNYTEIQSGGTDTTSALTLPDNCDPCAGDSENVTHNNVNNLMCDPPTAIMYAGFNKYTGLQNVRAVETPPECALNLMRHKYLGQYVRGIKRAMPREMNVAYEKKLEQLVIDYGRYTSGEHQGALLTGNGSIPCDPAGTADYGTFLQHAELLRAVGWVGPVIYAIGHSSLQNMIRNHKTSANYQLESRPFTVDDLALNAAPGDLVMVGDIGFKILQTPPRGYVTQVGTGTYKFNRVDPREIQPGSGAGVTAEYDVNYQNAWITCNGNTHRMVELSYFVHPMASHIQPFAMKQIPDVPIEGNFNMEVKVIRGAYLECNKDDSKFIFRAKHFFKYVPTDPRLMGVIAHLYAPYKRFFHAPDDPELTPEVITLNSPELCPPLDNACCDVAGGSNPATRKCVEPTAADPAPANGAGEFRVQCTARAEAGATSIDVCVERFGGCNGAASIQGDTSNGTALAGTHYTAVVADVLNWADGEDGTKCVTVSGLANTSGGDLAFDIDWTSATGAATVADFCSSTTVTITDAS